MKTLEGWFAELGRARREADARIQPHQAAIGPGDYFVVVLKDEELTIYGQVVEPETEEDKALYRQPHMRGLRLTRCYSASCPQGELGDTHVSTMTPVPEECFRWAERNGWPVADLGLLAILAQEGWLDI